MPKTAHSTLLQGLVLIHIASLVYFIYMWFKAPPFPPTLVINLDSRPDKWFQMQADLTNWPSPPSRIAAIKATPGWKGCFLSHRLCIETAKRLNYSWVLVLEDDCQMAPDAIQRFTDLLPYLWHHQHEWDIFMGGMTYVSNVKLINRYHALFRAKGLTTHFCLIHRGAYDKLLHHMPTTPDKLTDPVDVVYSNTFRLWTTYPFLATQRPTKSDIEDKTADYSEFFEIAGEHFQALLK
jgi:GR25 family glycosyltransferase involved in LPS biosynthesis